MNQNQYDLATAEVLMKFAYSGYGEQEFSPYEIKEDGVYVTETFRDISSSGTVFDWTPADEMDWPGSPNPNTAPFLPIPFDAAQLAAAMIDGAGHLIQQAVGHRIGYPLGDDVLKGLFSARTRWAREALTQAYALAAAAQSVVGEFDHDREARAHAMAEKYEKANKQANDREGVFEQGISPDEARARRARAVASISELNEQVNREKVAVAEKWEAWRKAIVWELLKPRGAPRDTTQAQAAPATAADLTATPLRKKRRDLLAPLIEKAQSDCLTGSNDAQAVFALLRSWAQSTPPRAPLVGVTEDGRIQWSDSNDKPRELTAKALRQRLTSRASPTSDKPEK